MTDIVTDRATLAEITDRPRWTEDEMNWVLVKVRDGIAAREALARVDALHRPVLGAWIVDTAYCTHCGHAEYPCPTVRAITGEA